MKKFLLIVFLVILFVVEVNAIDFRLVGGISFSRTNSMFVIDMIEFVSCGKGFLLGCGAEFTLSKKFSIEIDGLYFQKRSVYNRYDWDNNEVREFIDNIDEISFPVLVKFKRLFSSSFFLLGGGEFAYDISGAGNDKFDYGVVFGGGIEIKKIISSIEIRCHIGYKANTVALVLGF